MKDINDFKKAFQSIQQLFEIAQKFEGRKEQYNNLLDLIELIKPIYQYLDIETIEFKILNILSDIETVEFKTLDPISESTVKLISQNKNFTGLYLGSLGIDAPPKIRPTSEEVVRTELSQYDNIKSIMTLYYCALRLYLSENFKIISIIEPQICIGKLNDITDHLEKTKYYQFYFDKEQNFSKFEHLIDYNAVFNKIIDHVKTKYNSAIEHFEKDIVFRTYVMNHLHHMIK